MIFLAGQFWIRVVCGIIHVKILVLADICALQIGVERFHRFFRADVAKHAVGLQRIAPSFRCAQKFHLGEIAILNRAPFHRCKRRRALAHVFERLGHVFGGDVHRGHLERQILVIAQFEFRQHFKNRAEFQRLPFVEIQFIHLRLRHWRKFLLRHRFFHPLRHQRLQHFSLDVLREFPPD